MAFTQLRRIVVSGLVNFWRNGLVSFAAAIVMVLALFIIEGLVFSQVLLNHSLNIVKEKIDITVYFRTDATEGEIFSLRDALSALSEVRAVEYVSRDDALARFKELHKENALLTGSLDELGTNPLGAELNIRAKDPSNYEAVAVFLEQGQFLGIDKVNYRKNKQVIDRLAAIISASRQVGAGIAIALGGIAMLIVFNTIRLAIYTSKDEIEVMKLVGATQGYVRSPFLVSGALYGLIASVLTTTLYLPITYWGRDWTIRFFDNFNIFDYYLSNFFQMFFILLALGVLLGTVSSYIAARRYLRI